MIGISCKSPRMMDSQRDFASVKKVRSLALTPTRSRSMLKLPGTVGALVDADTGALVGSFVGCFVGTFVSTGTGAGAGKVGALVDADTGVLVGSVVGFFVGTGNGAGTVTCTGTGAATGTSGMLTGASSIGADTGVSTEGAVMGAGDGVGTCVGLGVFIGVNDSCGSISPHPPHSNSGDSKKIQYSTQSAVPGVPKCRTVATRKKPHLSTVESDRHRLQLKKNASHDVTTNVRRSKSLKAPIILTMKQTQQRRNSGMHRFVRYVFAFSNLLTFL